MDNPKHFLISNEKVIAHFETFLIRPDNDRIIFSGIFGIGKTTFLNTFFENHDKYIPIHIYPTNYSIASNEDIFELIKYDILYVLLCKKVYLEKLEFDTSNIIISLDTREQYQLINSFINVISDLGKKVKPILEVVPKLVEFAGKMFATVQAKKEKLNIDDARTVKAFHENIESKAGSIYENDFYTELITKLVSAAKRPDKIEGQQKEVVLIVDDLDRIDPEHIFRIINIFAAHFDVKNLDEENKFGLNRIILSCDINNVRNIFKNKYGGSVDFNGYIDKFYSKEVYKFDNRQVIIDEIRNIISSIKFENSRWGNYPNEYDFLIYLLGSLVVSNKLNLRSLKKLYRLTFPDEEYAIFISGERIWSRRLPMLQMFNFLSYVFGSVESLLEALVNVDLMNLPKDQSDLKECKNFAFNDLIMLVDYKKHRFILEDNRKDYSIRHELKSGSIIRYRLQSNSPAKHFTPIMELKNNFDPEDLRNLLLQAIEKYDKLKNGIDG